MRLVYLASAIVLLLAICALSSRDAIAKTWQKAPLIMVYDRGSMKEVYQDNGAAKINLAELKKSEHVYALGPLSKLRGEIMILDSVPYESRIGGGRVQIKTDWNETAAFLVWASVPKWRKIRVPASVLDYGLFDAWLETMTVGDDAPLRSQFPFLLKGKLNILKWHIVNRVDDGEPISAAKHNEQRFYGKARDIEVEMLGFYSPAHKGLFIPDAHSSHIHVKSGEDLLAHVDDFEPKDEELTLYVPTR